MEGRHDRAGRRIPRIQRNSCHEQGRWYRWHRTQRQAFGANRSLRNTAWHSSVYWDVVSENWDGEGRAISRKRHRVPHRKRGKGRRAARTAPCATGCVCKFVRKQKERRAEILPAFLGGNELD